MEDKKCKKYYLMCELCNTRKKIVKARHRFDDMLICDNCYVRETKHPVEYTPPAGEVHYDKYGRLICHECGRAYNKLTPHLMSIHNITAQEYKEKWGLNKTFKLTSENFKQRMRVTNSVNNLKEFNIAKYNHINGNDFNKGKKRRLQSTKAIKKRKTE